MTASRRFDELKPVDGLTTADWANDTSSHWSSSAAELEQQLEPVGDVLHDGAAVQPGERVLDVGCGRGSTTRRAAIACGPTGSATGIDVSAELIQAARDATPANLDIEWVVDDAQRHRFPERVFDAVISRFGVMFFDDAVEALAHLRRATAPGGRLCVVVWQRRERSEVMHLPLQIAQRAANDRGTTLDISPPDQGAFAWSDPSVVVPALEAAGWADVHYQPHQVEMYLCGRGPVERIVKTTMSMGGVRRALEGEPADVVDAVRERLVAELGPRHDGTGVKLQGAIAVVTARGWLEGAD